MKTELDRVLDDLPRSRPKEMLRTPPNAWVYIDDAGRLAIFTEAGWLGLEEKNLSYLKADGDPFRDIT